MTTYEDDDIDDEVEDNELSEEEGGGGPPSNNRNFILALGIMGGIFILILIALFIFWFTSRGGNQTGNGGGVSIEQTNAVIETANAETASAATMVAGLALTPSITPSASNTPVPPTATNTPVIALPTASTSPIALPGGGVPTLTPNLLTRTATIVAILTENAKQTQTQAQQIKLTGTATALPKTGFAEDVGLPGLFGLAIGLVLVIVLVRRLRLSPNG